MKFLSFIVTTSRPKRNGAPTSSYQPTRSIYRFNSFHNPVTGEHAPLKIQQQPAGLILGKLLPAHVGADMELKGILSIVFICLQHMSVKQLSFAVDAHSIAFAEYALLHAAIDDHRLLELLCPHDAHLNCRGLNLEGFLHRQIRASAFAVFIHFTSVSLFLKSKQQLYLIDGHSMPRLLRIFSKLRRLLHLPGHPLILFSNQRRDLFMASFAYTAICHVHGIHTPEARSKKAQLFAADIAFRAHADS